MFSGSALLVGEEGAGCLAFLLSVACVLSVLVCLLVLLVSFPVGTQRENGVVSTSMRRDHVVSTLIRRHFDVVCLLGLVRYDL